MAKVSRIVLGLLISSAVCLGVIFTLINETKAHAASTPGGLWVTPTTDYNTYEPGIWYTFKFRAYSPAGVDHVNFTAGDPWNRWYILCSPTQPDSGTVDTYSCSTDFRPTGIYFGGGTIHLSFDVYGRDGGVNYAPNGERTETYKNSQLGGTWNSPSDGATYKVGDHIRFSANAYPSDGGHPIDHVAFTSNSGGSWHTVCTQGYPNVHEFGCDWYPKASDAGDVQISFDVYTTNPGEASYAPNGVHTLHIQGLAIPGGVWVSQAQNYDLGVWYTLKARAYPTNAGPSIDYVNFTGYWGGSWHIICQVRTPDSGTPDQYSCQTDFRAPNGGTYPGGNFTLSFDVYDSGGSVNHSPNGTQSGTFVDHGYGGTWNLPLNNFKVVVGHGKRFSANAYPTAGSYPIDHVAFTALYNNVWHTVCTQDRPNVHTFVCYWSPDSSISGSITVSFDVYYSNAGTITYVSYSPNGTRQGIVLNPAKLSLKAPFPAYTNFTIVAGYNDNFGNPCTPGTPSDHCNNQLFGLDFATTNGSVTTLAPVGGVVTQIYQYQFQGQPRDCIFIQMDDNLNLSLCHILPNTLNTTNVFVGAKLVQGTLIGNNDGHVHLNIDMREATGHCCNNYPPVPFTGYHTIEGKSFTPNHDGKGVSVSYLGTTYVVDVNEWYGDGWIGQSSNQQV